VTDAAVPSTVQVHRRSTTMWVELRAPRANALSPVLVQDLTDALIEGEREQVRAVVLLSGRAQFCSGFDLSGIVERTDDELLARFVRIELLLQRLRRMPATTVCLVDGWGVGAGADLVLACNHRVGTPNARFRFPGGDFGVALGKGQQRARLTDAGWAAVAAGRTLDAAEAVHAGVLTEPVDPAVDGPERRAVLEAAASDIIGRGADASPEYRRELTRMEQCPVDDADELLRLVRTASAPGLQRRMADFASRSKAKA